MTHVIYTEFAVTVGDTEISTGEARYSFTVKPGRAAVTWANASEGFSPAEPPTVDLTEIAVRTHPAHGWTVLTGVAFDMLSDRASDEWLLAQIEKEAA